MVSFARQTKVLEDNISDKSNLPRKTWLYEVLKFKTSYLIDHLWQLTHWGWVMNICIKNLTIIGSENGLSPGQCQAIIWTNAGILLMQMLGTNFSGILSGIHTFSFKKMHLKMSAKRRQLCLGLNVLNGCKSSSNSIRYKGIAYGSPSY